MPEIIYDTNVNLQTKYVSILHQQLFVCLFVYLFVRYFLEHYGVMVGYLNTNLNKFSVFSPQFTNSSRFHSRFLFMISVGS